MVKIMDLRNSKGRDGFWEAYRACAEENRVRPDRSAFYVNWAKDFANFSPGEPRFSELMEAGKTEIRARHYSYRTETPYVGWVRRFIAFHNHANPRGLAAPTAVKTYLDYLSSLALLRMLYEPKGTCQDKNTPVRVTSTWPYPAELILKLTSIRKSP